jgi:hypothetical protein
MKRILLTILILSLISAGCEDKPAEGKNPEKAPVDLKTYSSMGSMEEFSISLPDWEESPSDDPFNNLTLRQGACFLALNIVDAPVVWYEKAVEEFVVEKGGTILSEEPFSYTLPDGGYTFETRTRSLFCDDMTYFVLLSCLEGQFDEETAGEVFDSMACKKEWKTPQRENRKLGLVVSPRNTTDIKSYYQAFNLARDSGVQMTHVYASWGQVEEEGWINNDFLMNTIKNKGLRASVVFGIIHTSVKGPMPMEFTSWDDPEFIEGFSDFVIEFIDRYGDTVEYVEIGNEVDIYFNIHPDELESYEAFYKGVYDRVKRAHPDMKVGTVFAYHELKNNGNFEVYHRLSPLGDFDAFTMYVYNLGFKFDRNPKDIYEYLKGVEELTGDRPFALEEVGWNTYQGLQGTQEDQRQAVGYFFDYLEGAPERLEFLTWFTLHDGTEEDCLKQAKSFIEPGDPILENREFMEPFTDFICHLGLIQSDGTPKPGWNEFVKRGHRYGDS